MQNGRSEPANLSLDPTTAEQIIAMEKALSERPRLSIRFRISLAFSIAFLFSFGIGISSMIFISRMNAEMEFFDSVGNLVFHIEQARRHEKNFFLYEARPELFNALDNIDSAAGILDKAPSKMRSLLREGPYAKLRSELSEYAGLLTRLSTMEKRPALPRKASPDGIEGTVRISGHQILTHATELLDEERIKARAAARTFMFAALFAIIMNLVVMIWVATELARQILQPLGRAVEYTERIAAGDFRPVTPKRKYRDEFSTLAIAINRMIRELLEKHDQLLQSRKMAAVGTLTSGIAHELNNPLNNISLTTETLLESMDDYSREEVVEMLKDIFLQVERASGTVRNLLDFTRLDQPRAEAVDVTELVSSSEKLVENERMLFGVEMETRLDGDLPRVRGNFRNLQQVLVNILVNGIQAMPDGGRIRVRARKDEDGKFVRVDVQDNGCGIPQENLTRVFDPFFTTKEVGKGTGLGLSVSYGIIKKLGGRITVDSEEGEWTLFSIHLPVMEPVIGEDREDPLD
ncbi:MAG: HAMP domain-containing sensor histidine kinase [Pseudomonadota bacterium]